MLAHRRKILSKYFLLIPIIILYFFIGKLLDNYFLNCVFKEFLSWDGDLRYVETLKLWNHFKNGEIFSFFFNLIDTPTWPFLRNILQLLNISFFGINPGNDFLISLGFTIITILVLFYSINSFFHNSFIGLLLSLNFCFLAFFSNIYLMYSFSSMLETQGGFFLFASVISFWIYFVKNKIYPLFFSFLGLYLTKYPYGYIFLVIVSIILFLKFPEEILNILKNYLSELNFFSNCLDRENIGKRSLFYLSIIFLLIYIFLPIQFWKGKSASYIKFIIGLFLAIDLVFFVLRRKEYIKEIRPEIFYLFVYLFLPVIIWTFIHPDRFSSSGGTLKHIQSEGLKVGQVVEKNISYYLFYIRVLFYEIWRFFPIGIFLFFTMAFAFIKGAYTYLKTRKIRFYFLNSIFIVFSLLILTFGTPNHQARHTYHLVPLLIFQFPLLVSKKRNLLTIGISIIPFILSGYFLFFLYSKEFSKSYLCFSGVEKIYEMPLEFEKVLEDKLQSPSFLYNGIEENHLNRADIELIFAKVNSEKNLIFETNKRKFLKQKEKFPVVVSVSRECISELNLKEPLIKFEEKRIKDSCVGFWKN